MNWTTQSSYLTNNKFNKQFQKAAQELTKFRQFVAIKEAFGKNKGDTVNWTKVANVGTYGGTLTETNTMHTTTQTLTKGTLTVAEYGNSIPLTEKLKSLSESNIEQIIREGLQDDMVKCLDGLVERQMHASKLHYVGTAAAGFVLTTNGTATATNSSALNSYHIRKMRLELEKRNVPAWEGGDYVMICSLEAAESLLGSVESVNQYTESGYTKILNGEVGRINGVRIVKDGFASRYTYDASARTATARSWTNSLSLSGYMFGSPTVREAIAVPEEIRFQEFPDYGRSNGIAWYALLGYQLEWDTAANSRIIVWDSAA